MAVVFPAVVGRSVLKKTGFDPAPLKELQKKQPAWVFIGDSMCRSRIDLPRWEQLAGGAAGDLIRNGSASARWYLAFKNHVVASGVRPKMTFIFFRDTVLTEPALRASGKYRRELEEMMRDDEPVVEKLLAQGDASARGGWLGRLYPVQERQTAVREAIEERLLRIAGFTMSRDGLRGRMNEVFDIANLRSGAPSDLASPEEQEVEVFDPSPEASFLPHLVTLARQHGLRLCFVRVKRASGRQPEWLGRYVADLRAYLENNGAVFYDETGDDAITPEMYSDGDHIARKFRPQVTERFYSQIRPLLPAP